jgi:hypothetical protein
MAWEVVVSCKPTTTPVRVRLPPYWNIPIILSKVVGNMEKVVEVPILKTEHHQNRDSKLTLSQNAELVHSSHNIIIINTRSAGVQFIV